MTIKLYCFLQESRLATIVVEASGESGSHEGIQRSTTPITTTIESFSSRPVRQHDTVKKELSKFFGCQRPTITPPMKKKHYTYKHRISRTLLSDV